MKRYEFPYTLVLGKLDESHGTIEVSLSETSSKQLEKSAHQGGRVSLNEDYGIEGIYEKVLENIIRFEKKAMLDDPDIREKMASVDGIDLSIPIEEQVLEYLENLDIKIYYPETLQNMPLKEKTEKSAVKYQNVILSREEAEEFIKDKAKSKNCVVYVDDGKTLFWIYKSLAGGVVITEDVNAVERNVFKEHKRLTDISVLANIEEMDDSMFEGCESLERIELPQSIKSIGFNAFTKCTNLSQIIMKDGVELIDHCAFRFCDKLKELHIPSTVKEIDMSIVYYPGMFGRFSSVEKLYIHGKDTIVKEVAFLEMNFYKNIVFYGLRNSKVQEFCNKNKLTFEYLEN